MPINSLANLRVFQFDKLSGFSIHHGIFSRVGGSSPPPWESLNLGGTVGDERRNVVENRRRIFHAIDQTVESIYDVWQIHSSDVINVDKPRELSTEPLQADAIITCTPGITLFMRFADCVPILLYDRELHAVGIVHAGWQGTIGKIVQRTVEAMTRIFGSNPGKIIAGIGPSICHDHYQVGEDVAQPAIQVFGDDSSKVLRTKNGSWFFDLWRANEILLNRSGVKDIELSLECTACNTNLWFSHRAENGKTGRFAGLIGLSDHE